MAIEDEREEESNSNCNSTKKEIEIVAEDDEFVNDNDSSSYNYNYSRTASATASASQSQVPSRTTTTTTTAATRRRGNNNNGNGNLQCLKVQVYNDVLQRLQEDDDDDDDDFNFPQQLWLHFNRLPARYALDVNVERPEDVVTHMALLRQAEDPACTFLAYDLRLVQVNTNTNAHAGDSVHSYSSMDEGSEGSVKNPLGLGLPPTFGSLQNLEAFGFERNVDEKDTSVNITTPSALRAMHEITFSTVDKPKLLNQLTSLLSEMNLNIQEAHAFSTVDGFSLDVFVVDGWPLEETEQLRNLLDAEIKKQESKELPVAAVGLVHQKATKWLSQSVTKNTANNDVDIDRSLLKMGDKVASGSYGDLYRGTYCNQKVAIKVLKPDSVSADVLKEFLQEVKIMRKVQHENVVRFIGACTKPQNLCIVTEFMENGNLYDFMHKRKGIFRFQSLLRAAMDISAGMAYLHQHNIVHRDLKTANLLMNDDGVVKVADFGVARVQTQSGVMTAETGTYRWMAPEVIGHTPYDHKADVFSFGIVLWELLTGELPYLHLTPLQAAIGVVQKGLRPSIPTQTHPKLSDLMRTCWHQDPNLRPGFSEISETLKQIASER